MQVLRLPALGETMEEGAIIAWHKAEGEMVEVGDALYEVENEKSAIVVEAMAAGVLARIVAPVAAQVRVGEVVAVMAKAGESPAPAHIDELLAAASSSVSARQTAAPGAVGTSRPERKEGAGRQRVRAMPKARALAKSLGVDLASVQGTGRSGIITPDDVEAAASAAEGPTGPRVRERRRLRGYPRAMASAMARNWTEIPHFSQTLLISAEPLLARRRSLQADGMGISLNDLMVEGVARACREVPEANAGLADKAVVIYDEVNVAVGVDTDHGLAAPVVQGADRMDLTTLAAEIRRLADAARRRKLTFDDIGGATITTSNLGPRGVDFGTPIVSRNTAATIYFGTVAQRPVAVDGRVMVQATCYVSGAFDHRVVDGATGARFLAALASCLEYGP